MHRYFMCYWSFDIFLTYKYVQIPEKIGWMFSYSTDCFTCFYLITIACTMWLGFNLLYSTDTYIHVGTCKSHLINYNWFLTFYVLLKSNLEKKIMPCHLYWNMSKFYAILINQARKVYYIHETDNVIFQLFWQFTFLGCIIIAELKQLVIPWCLICGSGKYCKIDIIPNV